MTDPEQIMEGAGQRAMAVMTLLIGGSNTAAQELIAEDDDPEALCLAMGLLTQGLIIHLARQRRQAPPVYWQAFALRNAAFLEWWKDHGPTL